MKVTLSIQKIEKEKWLKIRQELKEIASPLNHKRNMRKESTTANQKVPPQSRQNRQGMRTDQDASETLPEIPIAQPESSQNQQLEESGEDSSYLSIIEEPLLVEVGYGSLHIEVP